MSTSLVSRRTADGKSTVVWKDSDPSEHALLSPVVKLLYEAIELLGVEPPRIEDAITLINRGRRALRKAIEARPDLNDDERREAVNLLHAAVRELMNDEKLLKTGGRAKADANAAGLI